MSTQDSAVRADLFAILDAVPNGYGALRLAIMEGRIDPVFPKITQVMRQGCLKAHLAASAGCDAQELPGAAKLVLRRAGEATIESAAETFIAKVRFGDKPANCPVLKTLTQYMEEWREQCVSGATQPVQNLVELDDEEFTGA